MPSNASAILVSVHRLEAVDLVAMAQCIAIDVAAFPHPSSRFVLRPAGSPVWIARGAGDARVLGFLAASERRGHDLYVEGLAVSPVSRRLGVGRALTRVVIDFARRVAADTLTLHVWSGNRAAVDLYRSEGFEVQRHLPRFYRPGAFASPDAYRMVRRVE